MQGGSRWPMERGPLAIANAHLANAVSLDHCIFLVPLVQTVVFLYKALVQPPLSGPFLGPSSIFKRTANLFLIPTDKH